MNKNNLVISILIILTIILSTTLVAAVTIPEAPNIDVTLVNQIPDPVEPGNYVDVRFRIENSGIDSIDNLKFEFVESSTFTVYDSTAIKDLGSIDSYQTGDDAYIIKYRIKVADDAISGDNSINVRYTLDNWNNYIEIDDFEISVNEFEPIVELVSAVTIPEVAIPGENVQLKLKVKSLTHAEIRDVKLSLDLEDTTTTTYYFAPIGSANEQIIEIIKPNQEKEVTFTLAASPDTPIDVEKIPLTMTYLDDEGNSYTKSYLIGIKTYEKPSYILALEDKTIYKKLQKGKVTFSIANTGKASLNYLGMELIEQPLYYRIISSNKNYIGNLDSDDFDTAEFEIYTENSEANELPLKVKLTYKDDYGKLFEEEHSVKVTLYDKRDAMKYGLEMKQGAGSIFNYMLLLLVTIFWVAMIMNLAKNKMPKGKKILWWIILIGTYVIGGILYYLMARDKGKK